MFPSTSFGCSNSALAPVGYDKVSKIAHYAMANDLTLKDAALKPGFVTADKFDRVVDSAKMVKRYSATDSERRRTHVQH
jgi:fumarate hydratase class II